LLALDARITIAGPRGTRTIPLASFFVLPSDNVRKENILAPGEIVTEVLLNPPPAQARGLYRKVRERGAFDFAIASAAVLLAPAGGVVSHARIVLGGVAPKPWRAEQAEKALLGKRLNAELIAQVAGAATEGAAPLAENEYKVALVRGILQETLAALA
jgi:xanthine dehydrogenase YagS FAD-binding subunit